VNVYLNGEPRELPDGATVEAAVDAVAPGQERGIAAALNGEVVPKSQWGRTRLGDGVRVEVVQAVQGG
jgi:sulfur carrier protein